MTRRAANRLLAMAWAESEQYLWKLFAAMPVWLEETGFGVLPRAAYMLVPFLPAVFRIEGRH